VTADDIKALVERLEEYGGRNTIHPHSGTWMLQAATAITELAAGVAGQHEIITTMKQDIGTLSLENQRLRLEFCADCEKQAEDLKILSELAVLKRYHQSTNPNCKTVRSSMVNIPHELLDRIGDALKDQP
jgi:hypothetical protein